MFNIFLRLILCWIIVEHGLNTVSYFFLSLQKNLARFTDSGHTASIYELQHYFSWKYLSDALGPCSPCEKIISGQRQIQ